MNDTPPRRPLVCAWTNQADALGEFAVFAGKTQSAEHIKPLHWYVACRLVLEGGFAPEDITPRPPFRTVRKGGHFFLEFDPRLGAGGERTILGGLKTKNVDVVVTRDGIGPVLAVSCKGVTGALRNLTNRMEETIGECTNLHITYPALVLGYLVLIRANTLEEGALAETAAPTSSPRRQLAANDLALTQGGEPVAGIIRFHNALRELSGRRGIRDDVSQYEAVALSLVDMRPAFLLGQAFAPYPAGDSPLRLDQFFSTLALRYDERFVYSAPDLANVTRRIAWAPASTAFQAMTELSPIDYEIRRDG